MKKNERRESTLDGLMEELRSLRAEVSQLAERLAAVEIERSTSGSASLRNAIPPAPTESAEPSEEILAVLSAAVAAYLGVKPRLRSIRVAGSGTWAQQGRATIQASHAIPVRREH